MIVALSDILLQVGSATASVGRVYTVNRVVARKWNTVALLLISADYLIRFYLTPKDIYLNGSLVFGALAARTILILILNLDHGDRWRRVLRAGISGAAWILCAVIIVQNQYGVGAANPKAVSAFANFYKGQNDVHEAWNMLLRAINPTVIALAGMGLGCLGESMGDMVRTRRCILGMGLLMTAFGITTHNWGQVFKNLVSDVSMRIVSAVEYQDSPLGRWFPKMAPRISALVRRFRNDYLTFPVGLQAKLLLIKTGLFEPKPKF
jgi:hypothetical protein